LALQQTHKVKVSENWFVIPYFYHNNETLKQEFQTEMNIKGVKIVKANFALIEEMYLTEKS